jgi:hypothetical protein
MGKKKNKQPITNNIRELKLEIDYDKLAEAIVKAQGQADTIESYDDASKEYIVKTISGKPKRNYFAFSLSKLVVNLFYILAVGEVYLTVLLVPKVNAYILDVFSNQDYSMWYIKTMQVFAFIAVLWISVVFFCILINIAQEIKKEKDRNFIVSVFSGITSVAALIVALVALFKGVG